MAKERQIYSRQEGIFFRILENLILPSNDWNISPTFWDITTKPLGYPYHKNSELFFFLIREGVLLATMTVQDRCGPKPLPQGGKVNMVQYISSKRCKNQERAKSILILDEEYQGSLYLRQSLESSGYRIVLHHPVGDFQIAELNLAEFDLIICDSDNGLGVWRFLLDRIRSRKLVTQLVLTSRKAGESEWYEALQLGVFDFLVKPYSMSEVLRITSNALSMNYSHKFRTA